MRLAVLVAQVEGHMEGSGPAVSRSVSGRVEKGIAHKAAVIAVNRTAAVGVEAAVSVAEVVLVEKLVRRRRRGQRY